MEGYGELHDSETAAAGFGDVFEHLPPEPVEALHVGGEVDRVQDGLHQWAGVGRADG